MNTTSFGSWINVRNWSIQLKLMVGFGVILLLTVFSAAPSLFSLLAAQRSVTQAIEQGLQVEAIARQVQNDLSSARREEQAFRSRWPAEGYENAVTTYLVPHGEHVADMSEAIRRLDDLTAREKQGKLAEINLAAGKMSNSIGVYRSAVNRAADLLRQRGTRESGLVNQLELASLALGGGLRSIAQIDLSDVLLRIRLSELEYRASANAFDSQQVKSGLQVLRVSLDNFAPSQAPQVHPLLDDYERAFDALAGLDAEIETQTQLYTTAAETIQPLAFAIAANGTALAKEQLGGVTASMQNTRSALIASIAATAILGLFLSIILTRQISYPLRALTQTAILVARGDLNARAEAHSRDEAGLLADAFNRMTAQLRDLIGSLEARVEARTAQLRASAEVARAASSILDPQELMQQTADLIQKQFNFYYAGIFLLDPDSHYAWLRAATGAAGQKMLADGHRLDATGGEHSMVGWVCANKQARIALDVTSASSVEPGRDAVRFANPLLPGTRSEMALPLHVGGRVLGALDVQSDREAAFEESDVTVLQSMADQIAIALENARLFSQAQSTIEENKHLVDQVQASLQQALWLSQAGQAIAIAQDTQAIFQIVVERVLQPDIEMCWLILFDPYETASPENLEISHTWSRAGLAIKRQRFSFSTFPMRELVSGSQTAITQKSQLPPTSRSLSLWDELGPTVQTLAFLPLQAGPRWIGVLALGTSVAEAFAEEKLRAYQALAIQMSVAIENRRLVESAQASLQELSAVYRRATREAWATALQSKPELADFSFARPAQAFGELSRAAFGETLASSVEPLSRAASGGQAAWSVPLRVRGQEIGALELGGPPRPMSEQERTLVETVATQTALALDGARLFDETQRLAGRERLINEITARIRASTGVPGILQTAARELATAMNVPHAVARIRAKTEEPRDPRDGTDDQTAQR